MRVDDKDSRSNDISVSGRSSIDREGKSISGDGGSFIMCRGDGEREVVIPSVIINAKGDDGDKDKDRGDADGTGIDDSNVMEEAVAEDEESDAERDSAEKEV